MKAQNGVSIRADKLTIPFPVSTKKIGFGDGFSTSDITEVFTDAVQDEIAKKRREGFPVARYDAENKQVFLEYANGSKEIING